MRGRRASTPESYTTPSAVACASIVARSASNRAGPIGVVEVLRREAREAEPAHEHVRGVGVGAGVVRRVARLEPDVDEAGRGQRLLA